MRSPAATINGRLRCTPAVIICGLAAELLWIAFLRLAPAAAFQDAARLGSRPILLLLALLAVYAAGFYCYDRSRRPGDLAVIVIFAVVFSLTLFAAVRPRTSSDIAIYAYYGRVAAVYHENPYAVVPDDHADDLIYPLINPTWHAWRNTYGPAWSAIAAAAARLGGENIVRLVMAFKAVALIFFGGCLILVWLLTRGPLDQTRAAAAGKLLLLAWNPVVLLETVQNGHNDGALVFFALLSVFLLTKRRPLAAGAFLGLSISVKYVTALMLPAALVFLCATGRGAPNGCRRRSTLFICGLTAVLVTLSVPYWDRGLMLAGPAGLSMHWLYHTVSPFIFLVWTAARTLSSASPSVLMETLAIPAGRITAALLLALLTIRMMKPPAGTERLIRNSLQPLLVFVLLACQWIMPWYAVWLIPLFILIGDIFGLLLVSFLAVFAYEIGTLTAAMLGVTAYGMTLLLAKGGLKASFIGNRHDRAGTQSR